MPSLALCVAAASAVTTAAHAGDDATHAQRVEAGRGIYAAHCASCHGVRGEGQPDWQRPDAAGDMPAPPHDAQGHTWKHSDAVLYRIVKNGWRDPYNKTQRLTMPAFDQKLSPAQMRDVVEYLKTMWTPEQKRFQREESKHAAYPPEAR